MKKKRKMLRNVLFSMLIVLAMLAPASFSCCQPEEEEGYTILKCQSGGFHTTSNPFLIAGGETCSYLARIYEPLVLRLEDGTFQPVLAESWDWDVDELTYTFHLQQNAYWHDGEPITADDVVFTFEKHGEIPTIEGAEFWLMANSITAIDSHTVEMEVDEVTWDFLELVKRIFVAPEHIWGDIEDVTMEANLQPVGSGPFTWKHYETGSYLELLKNENYYGQVPYIDEVRFTYFGSGDASMLALLDGQLDMIRSIDNYQVEVVEQDPNVVVEIKYNGPVTMVLYLNHRVAPFDEKEVRQAIYLALDFQNSIDFFSDGYALMPPKIAYVPEVYYNAELNEWPGSTMTSTQRIAAANEILDDLGYVDTDADGVREADGVEMEYKMEAMGHLQNVLIQEELAEIGIKVDLNIGSKAARANLLGPAGHEAWDDWDMMFSSYEADWFFMTSNFADEPWSEQSLGAAIGWPQNLSEVPADPSTLEPEPIQELLREIRREMDEEARAELFDDLQELWAEEMPFIVYPKTPHKPAYRVDRLTGWNPTFEYTSSWTPAVSSNTNLTSVRPIEE